MFVTMSNQYTSHYTQEQGDDFDWSQWSHPTPGQAQNIVNSYADQAIIEAPAEQIYDTRQQVYDQQQLYSFQHQQQQQHIQAQYAWQTQPTQYASTLQAPPQFPWSAPMLPSSDIIDPRNQVDFNALQQIGVADSIATTGVTSPEYLSPDLRTRSQPSLSPQMSRSSPLSRSISLASQVSSAQSASELSRSVSPNATEMGRYGFRNQTGSWNCAYPGCSSRSAFTRGCDLRKHYKRHSKTLFCRVRGCPQATEGGFSSKKDRARHEAKHNPTIQCEWAECDRVFSRVDNMKDHVRRVHERERRCG
ncbi:hypothetical protein K431DRAFT_12588 [Polychaeton citri CBS 116435]|uniref:C2H2-type domain-containing protein n=1 Tax=Polychaeton citri CBS 116435 TaxID=1314669 RepID=A0A9P4UIA0_9PEZI|nr:hypothetical protein K431DRAFT_12588 [Polychaeton citri CBS 116435]